MRKRMFLIVLILGIVLVMAGCGGGSGHSVSLADAQMAYAAVLMMAMDALSVEMGGTTLIDTALEFKKQNATGSLVYDR
jgi:hypothetical protein